MKPIIVAGINTEVGKSLVSAIVAEALGGGYWKPVQCGPDTDLSWVKGHLSSPLYCYPSPFSLSAPCSPHLAARKEGIRIEAKELIPPVCPVPLVIEGTGGLLAPLNEEETWADAARLWDGRWILVHRHYLGSLNHFFLTMEAMRERKLPLLGVIFNGEGDRETEEMLLKKGKTTCLGRLPWEERVTPEFVQKRGREWRKTLLSVLG